MVEYASFVYQSSDIYHGNLSKSFGMNFIQSALKGLNYAF